ncbi:MAG: LysM peptidoglycan-binding domain-containing protein [Puniceicoccales bacterium]|jgi:LysM repeat protein|nr:LysM peptidoglycan-binding domain-containing protein [Puniceicoccales bacterium]
MKLQNVLIVYIFTPLVLLVGGCSIFDDANQEKNNNVANFIAPEIASDGASVRKKPTLPKQTFEEIGPEDHFFEENTQKPTYEIYVVQKGDTIYGIARKVKMSPATLMAINGLHKDSKLMIGQRLKLENDKVSIKQSSVTTAKTTVYIVKGGDSLSKIAHMYGITIKSLKEINNLSSDKLIIGQKLTIPGTTIKNPNPNSTKFQGGLDNDGKYVVKQGDSLTLIAKHFGVKQSALQEINNISDPNKLRVGQKLTIPAKTVASLDKTNGTKLERSNTVVHPQQDTPKNLPNDLYTIKSGDTINKIARDLGVKKSDLIKLNNLESNSSLQEGKKLLIPQKKAAIKPKSTAKNPASDPSEGDFFDNFEEIPVIEINN